MVEDLKRKNIILTTLLKQDNKVNYKFYKTVVVKCENKLTVYTCSELVRKRKYTNILLTVNPISYINLEFRLPCSM